MLSYKRLICLLLTLLLLSGCAQTASPQTQAATESTVPETTESVPETVPETTAPDDTQPEPAFADYVCQYTDERDLAWEQDIVYFAQLYLGEKTVKGHPYLVNKDYPTTDANRRAYSKRFYDPAIRDLFIQEVFALIDRIPELTDLEINFELQRIAALLGDAHTSVYVPYDEVFPVIVEQLEQNGEMGLYCVRIPAVHENVLLARLDAINGIAIDEVLQRLNAYTSTENEYWALHHQTSIFSYMTITDLNYLRAAGIVGLEEESARFRFVTVSGETVEVELEALSLEDEYFQVTYANCDILRMGFLSYSQYGYASYFFDRPAEDALYIRLYQMVEEEEYRLEAFFQDIRDSLAYEGEVSKVIIDLRNNPGGYASVNQYLTEFLQAQEFQQVYILINGGSCSAAVIFPCMAQAAVENVVIVGTPAGQPPNFFANAQVYTLRKHDVSFTISTNYTECVADFSGSALMPDVIIYQKLDDYMNGVDTVLEYVLSQ